MAALQSLEPPSRISDADIRQARPMLENFLTQLKDRESPARIKKKTSNAILQALRLIEESLNHDVKEAAAWQRIRANNGAGYSRFSLAKQAVGANEMTLKGRIKRHLAEGEIQRATHWLARLDDHDVRHAEFLKRQTTAISHHDGSDEEATQRKALLESLDVDLHGHDETVASMDLASEGYTNVAEQDGVGSKDVDGHTPQDRDNDEASMDLASEGYTDREEDLASEDMEELASQGEDEEMAIASEEEEDLASEYTEELASQGEDEEMSIASEVEGDLASEDMDDDDQNPEYQTYLQMAPSLYEDLTLAQIRDDITLEDLHKEIRRLNELNRSSSLPLQIHLQRANYPNRGIASYIGKRDEIAISLAADNNRIDLVEKIKIYHGDKKVLIAAIKKVVPSKKGLTAPKSRLFTWFKDWLIRSSARPQPGQLSLSGAEAVIVVCSRWSGTRDEEDMSRAHLLHKRVKRAFTNGKIIKNTETAQMWSSYRQNSSVRLPLPIKVLRRDKYMSEARRFLKPFEEASQGTTMIIVSLGIDALSTHEASLVNFYSYWHDERQLEIKILVAEHEDQWDKDVPWKTPRVDWVGKFLERYWATLDLGDVVKAIAGVTENEFASEYLEQLRACARRAGVSEGRLRRGRNKLRSLSNDLSEATLKLIKQDFQLHSKQTLEKNPPRVALCRPRAPQSFRCSSQDQDRIDQLLNMPAEQVDEMAHLQKLVEQPQWGRDMNNEQSFHDRRDKLRTLIKQGADPALCCQRDQKRIHEFLHWTEEEINALDMEWSKNRAMSDLYEKGPL
ncbi:MAG: hypothetical protein Q9195_009248 [Heterodermia aff. obscurata]